MFFYLTVACMALVDGIIQVGLVTSPYTDEGLIALLTSDLTGVARQVQNVLSLDTSLEIVWASEDLVSNPDESLWEIPKLFLDNSIQVILDIANSIRYSSFLAEECINYDLLHIVISRPIDTLEDETTYNNTLYVETSFISQAYAIYDLLNEYGWTHIGLIQDETENNSQMSSILRNLISSPMNVLDQIIINPDQTINYNSISYRLQSTTRDSEARVLIIMSSADVAAQVLTAADASVMGGIGYTWILNANAMQYIGDTLRNTNAGISVETLSVRRTGAVGLMTPDTMYELEEPMSSYISILTLICQGYQTLSNYTGTNLYKYIMSNPSTPTLPYPLNFDSKGLKSVIYQLYNIINFAELNVGYWDPTSRTYAMYPDQQITWPGFTHALPNDTISIIQLGLLYPGHDNSGNVLEIGIEIKQGFDLAIDYVNNDTNLLVGYKINQQYIDTYLLPQLASTNLKSLASENILGFVGPHTSELALAYLSAQGDNGKPIMSYSVSETTLSNAQEYPLFLQIIQPDGLQSVALTLFLQRQGWIKIGVIYTNDDYGIGLYNSFIDNIGTLDIVISNTESKRSISYSLNSEGGLSDTTKQSIEDSLVDLVVNQIKVVCYLGNQLVAPQIARVGASKGLYGTDYAWVGPIWLTANMFNDIKTNYANDIGQIYNIIEGSIGLDYMPYQGTIGQDFALKYNSTYGVNYTIHSMLAYDAVLTYANVINGMIGRGDDYNDGQELINSLRSADLTGASGKIKFSEGSNGRSAYGYNIINYRNGATSVVYQYSPLNPNLFNITDEIVWAGGDTSPPGSQWPEVYDCPFAEPMSTISPIGVGVVIAIGASLFLLTLGLSVFSYKKWRQLEIMKIDTPVTRSWKDTLVQAQIGIEFFQFIAIAPTFPSLEIVVRATANVFVLDFIKVAGTSKSDYWILLATICGLCYVWFALVLVIMLNGEHWLKKIPFCKRTIQILNSVFLPFFGNTYFLPALTLLLDMYVCDHQAQGHAYVWRDCYTNCWEGKHLTFIFMSSVAIICYEPIAAYSRPLWQQSRTGLNLKIQPFFLLLKTCVQILLIAIGKSLQSTSPLAHSIVFTILISMFAAVIYRLRPFNYNRCNLWEFSSILAVSYLSFLATLSYSGDPTNIGWFVALMGGWLIIFGISMFIQWKHMPNLLQPPGGNKMNLRIYDLIQIRHGFDKSGDDSSVIKPGKREMDDSIPDNHHEVDRSLNDNEDDSDEDNQNNVLPMVDNDRIIDIQAFKE
jgi:ABC-type branched-subunit amino acid transport system substrate-binding protein